MEKKITYPHVLHKELLDCIKIPRRDVINSEEAKRKRKLALERARILGNNEQVKARITFKDSTGIRQVETTVTETKEDHIILKDDFLLPIYNIYRVEIL